MAKKVTDLPQATSAETEDILMMVDKSQDKSKWIKIYDFFLNLIETAFIKDAAVTTPKIANANVTDDKWRNGVAFSAFRNATAAVAASTFTKVTTTTEDYDIGGNLDAGGTFTAPYNGVYHFDGRGGFGTTAVVRAFFTIYVNGSEARRGHDLSVASLVQRNMVVSADIYLNAGDTVQLYCWTQTAATFDASAVLNHWNGHMVTRY